MILPLYLWTAICVGVVLVVKTLTPKRFSKSLLLVSLLVMASYPFFLQDLPFRGEHWAMLYAYEKSATLWDKLQHIVNFVCFGVHRFQPLNSLPLMLSYWVGGLSFFIHYAISLLFHLAFALTSTQWLFVMRQGRRGKWSEVIERCPLELALFLVLFVACDVISWTFFQYVQLSAILGVTATWIYLSQGQGTFRDRLPAYLLILLAILTYEPFVVILLLFVAGRIKHVQKSPAEFAILALMLCGFLYQYIGVPIGKPITVPGNVSTLNGITLVTGHDLLFQAPLTFNKPGFLVYNFTLATINLVMSVIWPTESHKTNLYELPNLPELFGSSFPYLCALSLMMILVLGFAVVVQRRALGNIFKHYVFAFFAFCGIFAAFCLGRPEAGHYSSVQFRYAFVLSPFLIVPLLDLCARLLPRSREYVLALSLLVAFNVSSSLHQLTRLRTDFHLLTKYVADLKKSGMKQKEIIFETSQTLVDYKIIVPGENVFLIYNGRGALASYVGKM